MSQQMSSFKPLLCKNFYASRQIQHVYFHPIPKHISITIQQAPGYAPSQSLSHDFEKVSLLTCVHFAIHGCSHQYLTVNAECNRK